MSDTVWYCFWGVQAAIVIVCGICVAYSLVKDN